MLEVATADHEVTVAFGRVLNLVAAPPSLLAPGIAWRVLGPSSPAIVRQARRERAARTALTSGSASLARAALPAG